MSLDDFEFDLRTCITREEWERLPPPLLSPLPKYARKPSPLVADLSWKAQANCAGMNPNDFFPKPHERRKVIDAKAVCAGCAVREKCLAWALDEGITHGVWGGTSERQRRELRRQRRVA